MHLQSLLRLSTPAQCETITQGLIRAQERGVTYLIMKTEDVSGILCTLCQYISFHPQDIINKYCGECNLFHEEQRS